MVRHLKIQTVARVYIRMVQKYFGEEVNRKLYRGAT